MGRPLSEGALVATRDAFDSVAPDYDRTNVANPTLSAMRRRVLDVVIRHVAPGSRILDLGCGPGTDHQALVTAGYRVTAIDWSPAMVLEARRRAASLGLADHVSVRQLGVQHLSQLAPLQFDAAYANFGPLNCVPDLESTARDLASRVSVGGHLVASVIGRYCPWDIAVHAWRGDLRRLRVRFARDFVPVPLNGGTVWTRYYTPGEFERPFAAAGFTRVSLRALALCAPPPYLDGFARRHARLTERLQWLDDRLGGWPGLRACGDHFLIVLKRA